MRPASTPIQSDPSPNAARGESALDRFEHRQIVLGPVENSRTSCEDADAVKFAIAKPEAGRVAFMEETCRFAAGHACGRGGSDSASGRAR